MPLQIPNEILLQIISWLVGVGLSLLVGLGSLAIYIFSKYKEDNDSEHSSIRNELSSVKSEFCEYRRELREDIKDLHERINAHLEAS